MTLLAKQLLAWVTLLAKKPLAWVVLIAKKEIPPAWSVNVSLTQLLSGATLSTATAEADSRSVPERRLQIRTTMHAPCARAGNRLQTTALLHSRAATGWGNKKKNKNKKQKKHRNNVAG